MLCLCFCMLRYEHFDCITMLDKMLTLCGTLSFVLSDNTTFFSSVKFKMYLSQRGISSNKCSINHLSKNGQAKKNI